MRIVLIVVMAVGLFVAVRHRRDRGSALSVAAYLDPQPVEESEPRESGVGLLRHPGLRWMASGAGVGLLLARGDLVIDGSGGGSAALALLGAAAGWFTFSARRTSVEERRVRTMRQELPVITDAIAMHVVSGESVREAIQSVIEDSRGQVSEELADAIRRSDAETSLEKALERAATNASHPDVRRLYETLAHAQIVGGRLSASLAQLAVDFRAALTRDLTAEGGRRAVASYGPVLALMVPTALLFLLYPTLLGLRTLSGTP